MPALQKKHLMVFLILIVQFLLSVSGGTILAFTPRENVIFPGVSINGVYVGGLREGEAVKVLTESLDDKIKNGTLKIQCGSYKAEIPYADLGVKFDISATVERVLKQEKRLKGAPSIDMMQAQVKKPDFPLVYTVDSGKLNRILRLISQNNDKAVQNAKLKLAERNLTVIPGQYGLKVDLALVEKKIKEALDRLEPGPLKLEASRVKPDIVTEDLSSITDSIGLGISHFSRADREKYNAIGTAVQRLDGTLIRPGEEFSFNSVLGNSVNDKNYLDSGVILKEGHPILVSDNFMSQVASTLYQAVLYSELPVTERHAHQVMPGYVSAGQDVAVGAGKLDFKFKNEGKTPVYILAETRSNYLVINLLGVKKDGRTVQVITRQEEDPQNPGLVLAKVYRVIYDNGAESGRELVSEDRYLAAPRGR